MTIRRKLVQGDEIPQFWTRDITGQNIDSSEFSRDTLLVFLRYAGCPFCNLAIVRLTHEYKMLKKNGCDVIVFVQSSQANIEKNILSRHSPTPPFPIIADQEQDLYKIFGVRPSVTKTAKYTIKHAAHWMDAVFNKDMKQRNVDGNAFMVPAYFLVNKHGRIRLADYEANMYEDTTFTPIYEHLNFDL